jgi:hypothetical protein
VNTVLFELAPIVKCPIQSVALNPNGVGCVGCTYSWWPTTGLSSSSAQNPTTSSTQSIQYTLTVNYPNGCQETGAVSVNVLPSNVLPAQTLEKCKVTSVPLNPSLTGSCVGCTYSWSPSFGLSSTTAINPNVSIQQNQNYTLTITKPDGCQESLHVSVTITPTVSLEFPPVYKCQSGSVPINPNLLGSCSGCTYSWSPTSQLSSPTNTINPNTNRSSNGSYTLTVTQPDGCQLVGTIQIIVTPNTNLQIPSISKCANSTVPLNPNLVGECSGCTYSWNSSSFLSSTTDVNPNTSINVNAVHTLTVNSPGNCPAVGTVLVNITPPSQVAMPAVVRCNDSSPVNVNPSLSGACAGCTYSWSPSTGLSATNILNPTTTANNIAYTLTINLPTGCQNSGVVSVGTAQPSLINSNFNVCMGSSAVLNVTNPNPNSAYSWSPISNLSNNVGSQINYTTSSFGVQNLVLTENQILTSGQTCVFTTPITVNVLGVDLSSVNQFINICENTCQEIGLPAQNGVSYSWSPSDDLNCSTCANPEACPDVNTQYTLTAMHNSSGCVTQTNVNVAVYDVPLPQITSSNMSALECVNEVINLNIDVTPPGQYGFSWSPANLFNNPNVQSPSLNSNDLNLGSNNLYVHITDYMTGCSGILDSLSIQVINYSQEVEISAVSCGEYVSSNGLVFNSTGVYNYLISNASGCDSLVTLHLTVHHPTSSEITETACESYTWPLNGNTYSQSGIYSAVLQNSFGCDSIITLNLTIQDSPNSVISVSKCEFYTWDLTGVTYTTSGSYSIVFPNISGCDSTVTLNLTITHSTSSEITETACASYTWPLNGITYTESGSYSVTLQSSTDCDSTVLLHLTILQSSAKEITQVACDSFYWNANGQTYTYTGIYFAHLSNAAGCDSIVTLNLLILDFNVEITTSNGILFASGGEQFQWISCPSMAPIPNATNPYFSPLENGIFAVVATDANSCVDTSLCVAISGVGLENENFIESMIYPNPTYDYITVEFSGTFADVELYDAQGKIIRRASIQSGDQLSLENEQSGVYFVRIISEIGTFMHRVVKQQ